MLQAATALSSLLVVLGAAVGGHGTARADQDRGDEPPAAREPRDSETRRRQAFSLTTRSRYPSVGLSEYTLITDDLERDRDEAEAVLQAKMELPWAMHTKEREHFEQVLGRDFTFQAKDEFFGREGYIQNRVEDPSHVRRADYRNVVVQLLGELALVTYSNVVEDEPGGPGAWKADMTWADVLSKEDGRWKYLAIHQIEFTDLTAPRADPRDELAFFEGRWTLEGSEETYLETCEWQPLSSYLSCRAEDRSEDPPAVSLSLLGYSPHEEIYTHTGFGSSPRVLRGWRHDGTWVFTGHREGGTQSTRWQVTITPTTQGFHFRQETSINGGPWATSYEALYLRLP